MQGRIGAKRLAGCVHDCTVHVYVYSQPWATILYYFLILYNKNVTDSQILQDVTNNNNEIYNTHNGM